MKSFIRLTIILMVIGVRFLNIQAVPYQKQLDSEKHIWQLEERYWESWINGDIESFLSLIHEDAITWAASLETPADKHAAGEFFQKYLARTRPFAYEIKPAAIRIISNVSIVHYSLIWKDKDGKQIGSTNRITHTWIEQEGNWKILGGMSSVVSNKL